VLVIHGRHHAVLHLDQVHLRNHPQPFARQLHASRVDRLREIPDVGQRRRLGVHPLVLDGTFHRVDALREESLYPLIEKESGTVRVLVDHTRRQIVRQFPLGFDLDRQCAH
jgi:hypothetical protein